MADSLPPTTDEELAAIERRIDAFTGSDHYRFTIDGIEYDAHWAHDTRRLLDENARLNAENDDMRKRVAFAAAVISGDAAEMLDESLTKVRAELDRVIREAAADRFERDTVIAEHKVVAADALDKLADTLENLPSGGEALKGPHWYREGVKAAAAIARDEAYHLRPTAPEMPRPPAEEPSIPMRYGPDCAHKPEWHCSAHGECRACECGCFTYPPTPAQEGHREAVQEAQERPETREGDSGIGTGGQDAHGRTEADR